MCWRPHLNKGKTIPVVGKFVLLALCVFYPLYLEPLLQHSYWFVGEIIEYNYKFWKSTFQWWFRTTSVEILQPPQININLYPVQQCGFRADYQTDTKWWRQLSLPCGSDELKMNISNNMFFHVNIYIGVFCTSKKLSTDGNIIQL